MSFKTNLRRHKGTKAKPQVGDVFGLEMPGKGWLFGRVVRTDAAGSGEGAEENLIYIYNTIQKGRTPIPELDKEQLLIQPQIVTDSCWRHGLFLPLEHRPVRNGDFHPRHCFRLVLDGCWGDEFHRPARRRFEPFCGDSGLTMEKAIDDEVSRALGVPEQSEENEPTPSTKSKRSDKGEGTLTLYLPGDEWPEEFDVDELEDAVGEALERAGAGSHEGHGFNLAKQLFDTRFVGPNAAKLVAAFRAAIKPHKRSLPKGAYVGIRRSAAGAEQRVTF